VQVRLQSTRQRIDRLVKGKEQCNEVTHEAFEARSVEEDSGETGQKSESNVVLGIFTGSQEISSIFEWGGGKVICHGKKKTKVQGRVQCGKGNGEEDYRGAGRGTVTWELKGSAEARTGEETVTLKILRGGNGQLENNTAVLPVDVMLDDARSTG